MNKLFDILFRAPSFIFHPFWMPTYAIALLFLTCFNGLPTLFVVWALVGTFILTGIIPLLISILYVRNTYQSLEMSDRQSRIAPYIYTCICYACWCHFMYKVLHLPTYIMICAIGAAIALVILLLVTLKWKMSAHLTCFGGIIGSTLAICHALNIFPAMLISTLFALCIILAWSRIYMKAHTPMQLAAGFLIGITFTYFPCLII